MDKFAKLFETEEYGQIAVIIQSGDYGPEVRFFFSPKGFGVCSTAIKFSEEEGCGWSNAQKLFDSVDEKVAIDAVSEVVNMINQE